MNKAAALLCGGFLYCKIYKNNYTVSSRKRFLFYILMILSLLCIIALQFFGQNERDGNTTEKILFTRELLPGRNQMEAVKRSAFRDSMM